jgi:hypothetical protein
MYILGNLTLPTPKAINRELIETGATVNTLNGTTKKDITNRKEQYTLTFEMLTQAQVALILAEYNLQTTRLFSVTETNLSISPTLVHIDIKERQYNTRGVEYREDIKLILTESV